MGRRARRRATARPYRALGRKIQWGPRSLRRGPLLPARSAKNSLSSSLFIGRRRFRRPGLLTSSRHAGRHVAGFAPPLGSGRRAPWSGLQLAVQEPDVDIRPDVALHLSGVRRRSWGRVYRSRHLSSLPRRPVCRRLSNLLWRSFRDGRLLGRPMRRLRGVPGSGSADLRDELRASRRRLSVVSVGPRQLRGGSDVFASRLRGRRIRRRDGRYWRSRGRRRSDGRRSVVNRRSIGGRWSVGNRRSVEYRRRS